MSDAGARVTRSDRFSAWELSGGFLLYDGTELRLLEGSAASIFKHVDGVRSIEAVAERVAADQGGGHDEILYQSRQFLHHLSYLRILHDLAPPPLPGYCRPDCVGFVREGQVGLLVDFSDGRRRALSPSGMDIWELACAVRYPPEVARALDERYDHVPVNLLVQVQAFLDELHAEGWLTRWQPSSTPAG